MMAMVTSHKTPDTYGCGTRHKEHGLIVDQYKDHKDHKDHKAILDPKGLQVHQAQLEQLAKVYLQVDQLGQYFSKTVQPIMMQFGRQAQQAADSLQLLYRHLAQQHMTSSNQVFTGYAATHLDCRNKHIIQAHRALKYSASCKYSQQQMVAMSHKHGKLPMSTRPVVLQRQTSGRQVTTQQHQRGHRGHQ
jgi:hypothetical protein